MIHPRMATMLSIVLTDATASPQTLHAILRHAARDDLGPALGRRRHEHQRHGLPPRVGRPRGPPTPTTDPAARAALAAAVEAVARDLARQQARDGEGATALVTCQVTGAADDADARAVARAVIPARWSRRPSTARTRTGAGSPGPRATRSWRRQPILEAAGLSAADATGPRRPAGGRRPGEAPHRHRRPPRLRRPGRRSAAHRQGRGPRRDGRRGGPDPPRPRARDGTGEAFGCPLTEEYVRENWEYTT